MHLNIHSWVLLISWKWYEGKISAWYPHCLFLHLNQQHQPFVYKTSCHIFASNIFHFKISTAGCSHIFCGSHKCISFRNISHGVQPYFGDPRLLVAFIAIGWFRDHFVYAPSQWETTLQCNVVFHWLGTCTGWCLSVVIHLELSALCAVYTLAE